MIRILIADDHAIVRAGLKQFIADQVDMEVAAEAASGAEAIAAVRAGDFDVVLLDISMPVMDGYEVTSTLKGDPATKDTMVILFTARSEASDVEKGYQAGADDYIMKPFTLKTLQSRVAAALGRATETMRR